jgi:4-diphosphocytidyl-2-C-methyl-D-erythritol kinase
LRGLNRFFDAGLSSEKLMTLGAQLGSDVSFFVNETAAACSGRGEIVTPASLREPLSLLLLKPEFGVPSSWAYSRWQATPEAGREIYRSQQFGDIAFMNDLERPVFEKFVFLAQVKSWLLKQAEVGAALMSGSGSTIFAVLRSTVDGDLVAMRAKSELDPQLWSCVCETI